MGATRRTGQEQDREAPGTRGQGHAGGTARREATRAAGEVDKGSPRRWRRVRGGCDGHEERRKGAERRRCAAKGRDTVEGDVVMADTDKNPRRRARGRSGGGWSGGVRGRRRVRTERPGSGTRDVSWVRRAVWGRARSRTRCCSGMGYCTGAEHKGMTNETGRRWRGAGLCASGEARCQGSDLQEWRTGRQI